MAHVHFLILPVPQKLHLILLIYFPLHPPPLHILFFSDGSLSFEDNKKIVGAACIHLVNNQPIAHGLFPLLFHWGIFDAELFGAIEAIKYAPSIHSPLSQIFLHLDNQAVLYKLSHDLASSSVHLVCKIIAPMRHLNTNNNLLYIG
jgi:hypothetical protein